MSIAHGRFSVQAFASVPLLDDLDEIRRRVATNSSLSSRHEIDIEGDVDLMEGSPA